MQMNQNNDATIILEFLNKNNHSIIDGTPIFSNSALVQSL